MIIRGSVIISFLLGDLSAKSILQWFGEERLASLTLLPDQVCFDHAITYEVKLDSWDKDFILALKKDGAYAQYGIDWKKVYNSKSKIYTLYINNPETIIGLNVNKENKVMIEYLLIKEE